MKVTTKTGFECEINPDVMDDMEVLDLVVRIEKADVLAYPPFLDKIFERDTKTRLYDHIRTEDGRVPISAIGQEVSDILECMGEKK